MDKIKRVQKNKLSKKIPSKINLPNTFKKDYSKYNPVYRNFLQSIDYLKSSIAYVWIATALFFLTGLIGFIFPIFFVDQIKQMIQQLLNETAGLKGIEWILFIIGNNMQSALTGMVFGIFFGLVPIFIIIVNGYLLGFVAIKTVEAEGFMTLWRLLPHGVFEIPAIMISIGLGIKLGLFLFTYNGKNKSQVFLSWLVNSFKVFIFIVIPLLVIAGIIEGTLIVLMSN